MDTYRTHSPDSSHSVNSDFVFPLKKLLAAIGTFKTLLLFLISNQGWSSGPNLCGPAAPALYPAYQQAHQLCTNCQSPFYPLHYDVHTLERLCPSCRATEKVNWETPLSTSLPASLTTETSTTSNHQLSSTSNRSPISVPSTVTSPVAISSSSGSNNQPSEIPKDRELNVQCFEYNGEIYAEEIWKARQEVL